MIRQTCFLGAALVLGLASCASVQPPSLEPLTVLRSEALQRVIEPLPQNFSSQVNAANFQNVSAIWIECSTPSRRLAGRFEPGLPMTIMKLL